MLIRTDTYSDADFAKRYGKSAAFWDFPVSLTLGEEKQEVTFEKFTARSSSLDKAADYFYAPDNFVSKEISTFVPHLWHQSWDALKKTLDICKPVATMLCMPSVLGYGPLVVEASKRKSIIVSSPVGNMPLTLEVLRQIGPGALFVSTVSAFRIFSSHAPIMTASSLSGVHLAMLPKDVRASFLFRGRVFRDLHLMPAVSIAWQCEHISEATAAQFHLSKSFVWHVDGGVVRVTSIDERPMPFFRFRVCSGDILRTPCQCGESLTLNVYDE